MMSVTPLVPHAAIAVPAAEFEGLSRQEATELQGLVAMANVSAAHRMTPPKASVDARGTLIIHGCRGNDRVELVGNRGAQVAYTHYVNGTLVVHQQKFNGIRNIIFLAYDGNNTFINNTNLPSRALGGADVDRFSGGSGADVFFGLGGNDVLEGRAGSDRLYGGTGNDILKAGGGTENERTDVNILKGGAGHDRLFGSIGFDMLYGNGGNDKLQDDFGHGYLHGGAGNDVLFAPDDRGTTRNIEIRGGRGNDTIIVKPGVHPPKLWTRNVYFDDDIFRPGNELLQTLHMSTVNQLLA